MKGLTRDRFVPKFGHSVTICHLILITIILYPHEIIGHRHYYCWTDRSLRSGKIFEKNLLALDKSFEFIYYQFNLKILIIQNY
jgi:hypothetical protein